ncbi:protein SMALL AUXIN UP-REGULATED RNA 9-like [Coffea arabica]
MQASPQENSLPLASISLSNRSSSFNPNTLSKFKAMMWGKKIGSVKKLARRAKSIKKVQREPSQQEYLLMGNCEAEESSPSTTPTGTFALYVGEARQRFVVPTGHLSHPLFRMLLEKASDEFGFDQRNGLVVPCSVTAFQGVLSAVECCNGKFDFGDLVQEFI